MAYAITDSFKLALAQLNPVVGDIDGNLTKARAARAEAAARGRRIRRARPTAGFFTVWEGVESAPAPRIDGGAVDRQRKADSIPRR